MLDDTVCVWHSPVITHIKVATMPIGTDITFIGTPRAPWDDFGNGLDEIVTLGDGCPYSSLNNEWVFVHTADTCTQERTSDSIVFTRRSVSIGMKEPDKNYYGTTAFDHSNLKNCRWEIAKL